MPKPYSMDLRERVVAACGAGDQTREQVARQFRIGTTTVYSYLKRRGSKAGLAARPHSGGIASGLDRTVLREIVEAQNDATLEEYAAAYQERTGRLYSISRISRGLKEMKLSRKGKRSVHRSNSRPRS
ncbi:MAG: IS630 transposase-related protein [Gemmatimonadota bacterium]|nr:IS630 transposase-related protein [Gemmatimonadota bacterium]